MVTPPEGAAPAFFLVLPARQPRAGKRSSRTAPIRPLSPAQQARQEALRQIACPLAEQGLRFLVTVLLTHMHWWYVGLWRHYNRCIAGCDEGCCRRRDDLRFRNRHNRRFRRRYDIQDDRRIFRRWHHRQRYDVRRHWTGRERGRGNWLDYWEWSCDGRSCNWRNRGRWRSNDRRSNDRRYYCLRHDGPACSLNRRAAGKREGEVGDCATKGKAGKRDSRRPQGGR